MILVRYGTVSYRFNVPRYNGILGVPVGFIKQCEHRILLYTCFLAFLIMVFLLSAEPYRTVRPYGTGTVRYLAELPRFNGIYGVLP